MKYVKPSILTVDRALSKIQSGTQKLGGSVDPIPQSDNPAYEADE